MSYRPLATGYVDGSIVEVDLAAAIRDGTSGTASARTLGTGAAQAAAGNHLHSGNYASTAHKTTHESGGSDEITQLGGLLFTDTDGTGTLGLNAQLSALVAPPGDGQVNFGARFLGYRPVPSISSLDREIPFGSPIYGPAGLMFAQAGTGSTVNVPMGTATTTGTLTSPTPTTSLGARNKFATSAVAGNFTAIYSTDTDWVRGNNTLPWCGYWFHARLTFEDAAYANTGVSTGSRIFVGMTDQSAATMAASDNPAGHRHGFQCVNVNGGRTQTVWNFTVKNGTTESLVATAITLTQNHVYDFWIFTRPNGSYPFYQVDDLTAATSTGPQIDIGGGIVVGSTNYMRAMVVLQTVNATARSFGFKRYGVEIPA